MKITKKESGTGGLWWLDLRNNADVSMLIEENLSSDCPPLYIKKLVRALCIIHGGFLFGSWED